jgi:hypothetical protein
MKNQQMFCVAMSAALCTGALLAQEANAASDEVYEQLLEVTNFLGNYKEMASVSAEVSEARGVRVIIRRVGSESLSDRRPMAWPSARTNRCGLLKLGLELLLQPGK